MYSDLRKYIHREKKRHSAQPNDGFIKQLCKYEEKT